MTIEDAIKKCELFTQTYDLFSSDKLAIETLIEEVESRQKVVHCKDCKHWKFDYPGCTHSIRRCAFANWMIGENGYCLYGELEEDDNDTGTN